MSETNYHKYPWSQLLLYDYMLEPSEETMYEWWELDDDDVMYRFANLRTGTNVLVIFDPDLI